MFQLGIQISLTFSFWKKKLSLFVLVFITRNYFTENKCIQKSLCQIGYKECTV
jgi:hypothetical protein